MKLNEGTDYRVSYESHDDGTGTYYVRDLHSWIHYEYPLILVRLQAGEYVFFQKGFDEPLFKATASEACESDVMGRKLVDSVAGCVML